MFGIGIYEPRKEKNIGSLWRSAHLYGASFLFTIGHKYERQDSDTSKAWKQIPLVNYETYSDFEKAKPMDMPLVAVELHERAKRLSTYQHPGNALYLLGAEDHGLPEWVLEGCKDIIQVEALNDWSNNVSVAGSIVMWDRHVKGLWS